MWFTATAMPTKRDKRRKQQIYRKCFSRSSAFVKDFWSSKMHISYRFRRLANSKSIKFHVSITFCILTSKIPETRFRIQILPFNRTNSLDACVIQGVFQQASTDYQSLRGGLSGWECRVYNTLKLSFILECQMCACMQTFFQMYSKAWISHSLNLI